MFKIPCAIKEAELREASKDEAGDAGQWYMCNMYSVHEVRAMEQKGQWELGQGRLVGRHIEDDPTVSRQVSSEN